MGRLVGAKGARARRRLRPTGTLAESFALRRRRIEHAGIVPRSRRAACVEVGVDGAGGGLQQTRACVDGWSSRWRDAVSRGASEVEVLRGLLLEPEPIVLRRLLEEVGGLLE